MRILLLIPDNHGRAGGLLRDVLCEHELRYSSQPPPLTSKARYYEESVKWADAILVVLIPGIKGTDAYTKLLLQVQQASALRVLLLAFDKRITVDDALLDYGKIDFQDTSLGSMALLSTLQDASVNTPATQPSHEVRIEAPKEQGKPGGGGKRVIIAASLAALLVVVLFALRGIGMGSEELSEREQCIRQVLIQNLGLESSAAIRIAENIGKNSSINLDILTSERRREITPDVVSALHVCQGSTPTSARVSVVVGENVGDGITVYLDGAREPLYCVTNLDGVCNMPLPTDPGPFQLRGIKKGKFMGKSAEFSYENLIFGRAELRL